MTPPSPWAGSARRYSPAFSSSRLLGKGGVHSLLSVAGAYLWFKEKIRQVYRFFLLLPLKKKNLKNLFSIFSLYCFLHIFPRFRYGILFRIVPYQLWPSLPISPGTVFSLISWEYLTTPDLFFCFWLRALESYVILLFHVQVWFTEESFGANESRQLFRGRDRQSSCCGEQVNVTVN